MMSDHQRILAVRGAVTLEEDTSPAMIAAMGELIDALEKQNGFTHGDIVSLQFTQTTDIGTRNAASALREARPAYGSVPLFCAQEPDCQGSLPRTVRVLVTWYGRGPAKPVYLGESTSLRPDLDGGK